MKNPFDELYDFNHLLTSQIKKLTNIFNLVKGICFFVYDHTRSQNIFFDKY